MQISAKDVSALRQKTGAGIMDCKRALSESEGSIDNAIDYLRKKGLSAASKKAGRIATEGAVTSYVHGGGKIGVLLEVNCETDFVARNDDFKNFLKDVSMHIAAASPEYVQRADVPAQQVQRERDILEAQARESGKPDNVVEKMVTGRLGKYFQEICLLEQPFVKDPDKTVEQKLNEAVATIGEKIVVRRFVRWQLGEGLEKRNEDFASEVAAMANG